MRLLTAIPSLSRRGKGGEDRGGGRRTRRRPPPRWLRPARALASAAVALAVVAGAIAWLAHDGWFERRAAAATEAVRGALVDAGLSVQSVLVHGRQRTLQADVLAALAIERGDLILDFDPAVAKQRIEALPWVRTATVERSLPSSIRIRLAERQPLARWQSHGAVRLVDAQGDVIPIADEEMRAYAHLPLVVGAGADRAAPALFVLVEQEPAYAGRMTAAVLVSERRWNLHLDGRIEVRLPEYGASRAWGRLTRLDREHGLLERDILAVDLRLPDRLVVQLGPDARERIKDRGRST